MIQGKGILSEVERWRVDLEVAGEKWNS